ncbi:MAG: hypothetical protein ABIH72_02680 [archaeon]
MKGIKYIGAGIALVATFAAGALIGRAGALDRDYRVHRSGDEVNLESTSLDKSYALSQMQGEVYLGDSNHNLMGVQIMALQEGQQSREVEVSQLKEEKQELEGKIATGKLSSKVGEIGGAVKDDIRAMKHGLLE